MYHLLAREGIVPCIHAVFRLVASLSTSHRVVYINNTTPGPLKKALSASTEAWTSNPDMMKAFQYERVTCLAELAELLQQNYDLVVIEHLDHIVQEPTDLDYAALNRLLVEVVARAGAAVFIDDWDFLQRYYPLERLATQSV